MSAPHCPMCGEALSLLFDDEGFAGYTCRVHGLWRIYKDGRIEAPPVKKDGPKKPKGKKG